MDANLSENNFINYISMYYSNVTKNETEYEVPGSSSKTTTLALQDFHNLDHFYGTNGSSSSNPMATAGGGGVHQNSSCYDPFVSSTNNVVDFWESKPFSTNHGNGGNGHVMDNFRNGDHQHQHQHQHHQYIGNIFQGDHHMKGLNQSYSVGFDYPAEMKPMNFLVPDEVSCVSAAEHIYYRKVGLNRTRMWPTRRVLKTRKKPNVVKGQWTSEEDRLLIQLVEEYGVRKWSHIAQMLPGRIGKQCRERWHNHLRPDIKKDTWTEEEDRVLISAHTEIGNKWAEIAKRLPGRTENSIKNHWNATKRRQFSKRKCRSKYPRASLLQDYIKSLNLSALGSTRGKNQRKNNNCANNNNNNNNISNNNNTIKKNGSLDTIVAEANNNNNNNNNNYNVEEALDFCYDFKEDVLDFSFDEKLFGGSCSFDSLLDDTPNQNALPAPVCGGDALMMSSAAAGRTNVIDDVDEIKKGEIDDISVEDMVMNFEVKKELDLVEMIFQPSNV